MSTMLVLRCAAPLFAFGVAATAWIVAGPIAAGLTLVAFLLGMVTSELNQVRLAPVEHAAGAAADSAFLAMLEAAPAALVAEGPSAPAPPPRRDFQAVRRELSIGSGGMRGGLVARSRREVGALPPKPVPFRATAAVAAQPEAEVRSFRATYLERVSGG